MPAGDRHARTEQPTEKRRKTAREEGQVARSPEVNAWTAVLTASVAIPWLFSIARTRVLTVTAAALDVAAHPTLPRALGVLGSGLDAVLVIAGIAGGVFMGVGVLVSTLQVGRAASIKAARPRLSKVSPRTGLKRLFSTQAAWELAKQVLKLTLLTVVGYVALHGIISVAGMSSQADLLPLLGYASGSLLGFIRMAGATGLLVSLVDYGIQRHRTAQSIKMTKQEVKDERKSQEGDPAVRARMLRQLMSRLRQSAIAAVRNADVVIANPTHFAVALRYDPSRVGAPTVVAKGVDSLALRIREEAVRRGVPVVEDPPLARYLHAVCEVDEQVPVAVYVAVARVIAFVYSLTPAARSASIHRRPHSVVPTVDPDRRHSRAGAPRRAALASEKVAGGA